MAVLIALLVGGATGSAWAANTVSFGTVPGPINVDNPTRTMPVQIARDSTTTAVMGFSVVFTASSPLVLPAGKNSITDGGFLGGAGVQFFTIDLLNGKYQVDGVTTGSPCGSSLSSGVLFNILLGGAAGGGSGTVTLNSVSLRNCSNRPIWNTVGAPAGVTVDLDNPSVTLDSPDGGETWHVGSPQTITWTASDAPSGVGGLFSFDLAYSTDGGGTYPNVIATGVAGADRSYPWTVPDAVSSAVRVRVTAHDVNGNTASDGSDANFSIAEYTLDVTVVGDPANNTVTKSPAAATYHYGQVVTLTAVATPGWTFGAFTGDATGTSPATVTMNGNKAVTATFTQDQYTLTLNQTGNGTVLKTPDQTTYVYGTEVTLAATAAAGWTFAGFTGDVVGSTVTMNGNRTVAATFTQDEYTLDVTVVGDPLNSVTKSPAAPHYHYGDSVTLTAVPTAGWHFVGWSGGLTGNPTAVVMDGSKSFAATFEANPPVTAITNLLATQIRSGNPAGSTTNIKLTWTATPLGTVVEVWRKGFGHYPEYDDAGGAAPGAPASYAALAAAGWTKTAITAPNGLDLLVDRDFYYFVAFVQDGYGTWSPASNRTAGTLNYNLGDVSNSTTPGTGNNRVWIEDVSALGSSYGDTLIANDPLGYLDVGPTTNYGVDGRPTTDNKVEFEDLMMFAMNFDLVSKASSKPAAASSDQLVLETPATMQPGQTVDARVLLSGTGLVRGLSAVLSWDPLKVEPVSVTPGALAEANGASVLSAAAGSVDAAVLGTDANGFTGDGELAVIHFRALVAGAPGIQVAAVRGRDTGNHAITIPHSTTTGVAHALPTVTQLGLARPNPFSGASTISFSLASGGPVELALYAVDGSRIRTLARGVREPGEYTQTWDGRDDNGTAVAAGVYYVHFVTPKARFTRTVVLLK